MNIGESALGTFMVLAHNRPAYQCRQLYGTYSNVLTLCDHYLRDLGITCRIQCSIYKKDRAIEDPAFSLKISGNEYCQATIFGLARIFHKQLHGLCITATISWLIFSSEEIEEGRT